MPSRQTVVDAERLVNSLGSLECWYVSTGGAVGTTFELALGQKIRREHPLKNEAHPAAFRNYEGEANLIVWCDWRLDAKDGPLTSSDDAEEHVASELDRVVGRKIVAATLVAPSWDVTIEFSGNLILRIFADHVPGDPSFDGNWDLSTQHAALYAGPGARLDYEFRERVVTT